MKKSNQDMDYSIPRRQSYVAILLIIYKYYRIIIRQIWPFLILILFKRKSGGGYVDYIAYLIIGIAIISMFFAIIDYFRFYFWIEDDELHVKKGIFKKKEISIPLERVQTINFEENLIHRVFQVTSLKIDTAGSTKNEFDLDAINLDDAKGIRDFVLHRKKSKMQLVHPDGGIIEEALEPYSEPEELITHLGILDLVKIGISYNHFRSLGWIIGGFFWLSSQLDDMDLYPNHMNPEDVVNYAGTKGLLVLGFFALILFAISFVISLLRTILKYYDLSFFRKGQGFKVVSGLFTRQEYAALDNKIQMVGWKDNLLQKYLFGIFDFNLKQAGSAAINSKKSIRIAGLNADHINNIVGNHFPGLERAAIEMKPVHIKMLIRKCTYLIAIALPLALLMIYIDRSGQAILITALACYLLLRFYKNYKKTKYGIGQDVLAISGGTFGDENSLIKDFKIQGIRLQRNIYQRRHDLATVRVFTASGGATIPYIPYEDAMQVVDFLLYKVENSKRSWM